MKMAQYLAEELLDSKGEPVKKARATIKKCPQTHNLKSNKKVKCNIDPLEAGPADDADSNDNGDFLSESSKSDSLADNKPLTNAEICSSTMCYDYVAC